MEVIIDYCNDEPTGIPKNDRYVTPSRGQIMIQKNIYWTFLVKWKDVSESWIPLKDLKEYNPVDLAKYVRAQDISDEAIFVWWVQYMMRK